MKRLFLAFALILAPGSAWAQGTISSADPRATDAGIAILREGGSATDAAIAMMLALTVVEPQSSGIGGGGFLVHHGGKTGLIDTIDGRETAPAAAKPDRFLGPDATPLPFKQAQFGGSSVGVPGNMRLAALAHEKWGKLSWKALFQPAITLARDGFQVTHPLARASAGGAGVWQPFPAIANLYLDADGKALPEGATVKNPALAAFLTKLADSAPDAFYANGQSIVTATTGTPLRPSDLTTSDILGYQAKQRPAVCSKYRAYTLCGMGPPSSGATTVFQILGMLERFDLKALGAGSPQAWHLIGEAMQLSYADRDKYLGDRDFVSVPVAGLLDPAYMRSRSRLIARNHTLGAYKAGTPPGAQPRTAAVPGEIQGTTHFVAVDGDGDIVTMTSTVESGFGSQLVVDGYVLNNELTDFSFAPEADGAPVANRVEPGKRPLSSMSPTIVYDAANRPIFAIGAAGGRTIIMQVTKAIIAHLDWGMSARDAIGLGQIFFDKQGLVLEQGSSIEPLKPALEKLGHTVTLGTMPLKANAIERTADGWPNSWRGAADPRSVGTAANQ